MGAAASLKLVYFDAMTWFKAYLLGGSYIEDFRELDVNGDGGITFDELESWLVIKARNDPSWKVIVHNQSIFAIAHNLASKTVQGVDHMPNRVVGLESFKQFLLHLFVLSILWVHFKHADDWSEGHDVGNERLTLDEFKMAFRTFRSAQANEEFSEEKIVADFKMLDTDNSGSVEFTEVCAYCAQFVDTHFAESFLTSDTPAAAHYTVTGDADGLSNQRQSGHAGDPVVNNNDLAMQMMEREMKKNEHIADFEELKINTEVMLADAKPGAGWASPAVFQLGRGKTLAIPMSVHESARKKLVQNLHEKGIRNGIVLLQGGEDQNVYDTDTEVLFKQDSWFTYLFGVKEAGLYGAIVVSTGHTVLFIPRLPEEYKIWCGEIHPPSKFKESYAVDEVLYIENLDDWVHATLYAEGDGSRVHLMTGVNTDSGSSAKPASFPAVEALTQKGQVDTTQLYNILAHCRVTKSAAEIEVMRYVAWVASNAHAEMMRTAHENTFEYEFEAKFLYEIYRKGGCRKCAYNCIGACGPSGAVLHYGHAAAPNDRELQPTDMALLDMGAEYHGYVSDITCSFPVGGKFSADQRAIYQGVLNAQSAVLNIMVPGTPWTECHKVATRAVIESLLDVGILHNGSVNEIFEAHVGAVFLPHGLGHLIGLDTHDVGGYLPGTPARETAPGVSKLRTSRVLEANMVLTNEPGCYFIDALLDAALADPARAKYINNEVLKRFRGFGGVRLEDVVLVREAAQGGAESLSTCPRTIEEIEAVMAGGAWPPKVDAAPALKRAWTRLGPNGVGMELLQL